MNFIFEILQQKKTEKAFPVAINVETNVGKKGSNFFQKKILKSQQKNKFRCKFEPKKSSNTFLHLKKWVRYVRIPTLIETLFAKN